MLNKCNINAKEMETKCKISAKSLQNKLGMPCLASIEDKNANMGKEQNSEQMLSNLDCLGPVLDTCRLQK